MLLNHNHKLAILAECIHGHIDPLARVLLQAVRDLNSLAISENERQFTEDFRLAEYSMDDVDYFSSKGLIGKTTGDIPVELGILKDNVTEGFTPTFASSWAANSIPRDRVQLRAPIPFMWAANLLSGNCFAYPYFPDPVTTALYGELSFYFGVYQKVPRYHRGYIACHTYNKDILYKNSYLKGKECSRNLHGDRSRRHLIMEMLCSTESSAALTGPIGSSQTNTNVWVHMKGAPYKESFRGAHWSHPGMVKVLFNRDMALPRIRQVQEALDDIQDMLLRYLPPLAQEVVVATTDNKLYSAIPDIRPFSEKALATYESSVRSINTPEPGAPIRRSNVSPGTLDFDSWRVINP